MYSKLRGTAYFYDKTVNNSDIDVGIFLDTSINRGQALSALFRQTSKNLGYVKNAALMNGAINEHEMDYGYFYDNSTNLGVIYNKAAFFNYSINRGTVSGVAIFDDTSTSNGILLSSVYKSENVITSAEESYVDTQEYIHPDGAYINGFYINGSKVDNAAVNSVTIYRIEDYWFYGQYFVRYSLTGATPLNTIIQSVSDDTTIEYIAGRIAIVKTLTPTQRASLVFYTGRGTNVVGYTSAWYWAGSQVATSSAEFDAYVESLLNTATYAPYVTGITGEVQPDLHGLYENQYYLSGYYVTDTFEEFCNLYAYIISLTGELSLSALNLTGGEGRWYINGVFYGTSAIFYDTLAIYEETTGEYLNTNRWYLTGTYVAENYQQYTYTLDNIAESLNTNGQLLSTSRWYYNGDFAGNSLINYYDFAALATSTEREYLSSDRWYRNGIFVGENFNAWYDNVLSSASAVEATGLYQNTGYYFLTGTFVSESFEDYIDYLAIIYNTDGEYEDTDRFYSYGTYIGSYNNYIDVLALRALTDGEYAATGRFYHQGLYKGNSEEYIDFLALINQHNGEWESSGRWYINGTWLGVITDTISYYNAYANYYKTTGELVIDGINTSRYYFSGIYCCDTFFAFKTEEAAREDYTGTVDIDNTTYYFSGGESITKDAIVEIAVSEAKILPFTGKIPISLVYEKYVNTFNIDMNVEFANSQYANKHYVQGIELENVTNADEFNLYIDAKFNEYIVLNNIACDGMPAILYVAGIDDPIKYFSCSRTNESLYTMYVNWFAYSTNYGKMTQTTKFFEFKKDFFDSLSIYFSGDTIETFEIYKYSAEDPYLTYNEIEFANYVAQQTSLTGVLIFDSFPGITTVETFRYYENGTYVSHVSAYLRSINQHVHNGDLREGGLAAAYMNSYYKLNGEFLLRDFLPSFDDYYADLNNITGRVRYNWYDETITYLTTPPRVETKTITYESANWYLTGTPVGTSIISIADSYANNIDLDGALASLTIKPLLTNESKDYVSFITRYYCMGAFTGTVASSIPYMCRIISVNTVLQAYSGNNLYEVYSTDSFINAASRQQYLYSQPGTFRANNFLIPNAKFYKRDSNNVDEFYLETNSQGKIIQSIAALSAGYTTRMFPSSGSGDLSAYHFKFPLRGEKIYTYYNILNSQLSSYIWKPPGEYITFSTTNSLDSSIVDDNLRLVQINSFGTVVSSFSSTPVSSITDGFSFIYANVDMLTSNTPNTNVYSSAFFYENNNKYFVFSNQTNFAENVDMFLDQESVYISTNNDGVLTNYLTGAYRAPHLIELNLYNGANTEGPTLTAYSTISYEVNSVLYPNRVGSIEACCESFNELFTTAQYLVDADNDGAYESIVFIDFVDGKWVIQSKELYLKYNIEAMYKTAAMSGATLDTLSELSTFYFREINVDTGMPAVNFKLYNSIIANDENIVNEPLILYVAVDENNYVLSNFNSSNTKIAYGLNIKNNKINSIEIVSDNTIIFAKSLTFTQFIINDDYGNKFLPNLEWLPLDTAQEKTIYFQKFNLLNNLYIPVTGNYLYSTPFSSVNIQNLKVENADTQNTVTLVNNLETNFFSLSLLLNADGLLTDIRG